MLDQARREALVQGGVNFVGEHRVDAMWSGSDSRVAFWDQSRKALGIMNQYPCTDLDKRQEIRTQRCDDRRSLIRAV